MTDGKFLMEVRRLCVHRASRRVLDSVGAGIKEGELYGVIGANGSGKSTLLQTLAGLLPATSGQILYRNAPAKRTARRTLAREIAYLPQNPVCHWPLTVERLVTLGRIPHLGPWARPGNADRRAVSEAMAAVDVTCLADRPANRLSGGEQRRALLARALAGEPRLLLADEPSSGLDPYHQLQLMELLRDRVESGVSVILVLHNLALASRFCDRVLLLKEGKVLAEGDPTVEDALNPENLATAYGVSTRTLVDGHQMAVIPWDRI
jgi:iron complex transport system ATP-binding protein